MYYSRYLGLDKFISLDEKIIRHLFAKPNEYSDQEKIK